MKSNSSKPVANQVNLFVNYGNCNMRARNRAISIYVGGREIDMILICGHLLYCPNALYHNSKFRWVFAVTVTLCLCLCMIHLLCFCLLSLYTHSALHLIENYSHLFVLNFNKAYTLYSLLGKRREKNEK